MLLLTAVLAIYFAIVAVFYFRQNKLIFTPDPLNGEWERTPNDVGLVYENLTLTTQDDCKLHAWYIPSQSDWLVIYFHGNNSNVSHQIDQIKAISDCQVSVLVIEYRGYGKSQGIPSENGLYLDSEAAWQYATDHLGATSNKTIIHGRSLGGGVASYLSAKIQPAGLILESTYTSIPEAGRDKYPWLPIKLLIKTSLDTLSRLPKINAKRCIIHSPEDLTIPFHHAQKLYLSHPEKSDFIVIRGSHADGFKDSYDVYRSGLKAFISSITQ